MAKYRDRRDYKKIDIYFKAGHNSITGGTTLRYLATTTWAPNLKVAREQYALSTGYAASDLAAFYQVK